MRYVVNLSSHNEGASHVGRWRRTEHLLDLAQAGIDDGLAATEAGESEVSVQHHRRGRKEHSRFIWRITGIPNKDEIRVCEPADQETGEAQPGKATRLK